VEDMVAVGKLTERRRRRKEFCVCGEAFVAGGMEGRQAMIHQPPALAANKSAEYLAWHSYGGRHLTLP